MASINLGLKCGQMMAERADIKRMNIVERTRLWYRLERIGVEPIEPEQASSIVPGKVVNYRQLNANIEQLKARLIHAENKINQIYDKKKKPIKRGVDLNE